MQRSSLPCPVSNFLVESAALPQGSLLNPVANPVATDGSQKGKGLLLVRLIIVYLEACAFYCMFWQQSHIIFRNMLSWQHFHAPSFLTFRPSASRNPRQQIDNKSLHRFGILWHPALTCSDSIGHRSSSAVEVKVVNPDHLSCRQIAFKTLQGQTNHYAGHGTDILRSSNMSSSSM